VRYLNLVGMMVVAGMLVITGCAPRDEAAVQPDTTATVGPGTPVAGQALVIVAPEVQQVAAGEMVQILIQVDRDSAVGPVRLALTDLPPGVQVVGEEIMLRADERTHVLTLQASPTATTIVDHPVTIVARADGVSDVVHVFRLTVNES
jgi:hypothetical protein